MEGNSRSIFADEEIKVLKLKVKAGTMLYDGRIILIYESLHRKEDEPKQKKLKSTEVGIVKKILVQEGSIVAPGSVIVELEKKCNHPTVIKDLCAECGADLQKENAKEGGQVSTASVSMVHMVPELKVDQEHAQILGKADMDRLLEHKKLVLLVDLDQTLIHTTNDNIPNNIKDVYHFQLYGPQSAWYHTRLRPGTHHFLQGISEKYELHICTFGSRRYAHTITRFLDPDGKLFSHRILSRDECFDPNSKTANLRALFPCGEKMVCIIDDREDVWDYASNLIHVKPYHFFQHTGDIHAPPGLTKCENDDDKQGYDFSQLNESQNNDVSKFDNDEEITEQEEPKKDDNNGNEMKSSNDKVDHITDQNGDSKIESKNGGDGVKENPDEPVILDVCQRNEVNSTSGEVPVSHSTLQNDENVKPEQNPISEIDLQNNQNSKPEENLVSEVLENNEISKYETSVADASENNEDFKPSESLISKEIYQPDETSIPNPILRSDENFKSGEIHIENIPLEHTVMKSTSSEETPGHTEPDELTHDKDHTDAPDIKSGFPESITETDKQPEPNLESPSEAPVETSQSSVNNISKPVMDENGLVIIEETDDYLLYLEEILKTIHIEFFKRLEETKIIPDLKVLIPETRAKVLESVSIVFSGIIPNRIKLEDSQAYKIARSLGAKVTQNIENSTTHLVALRSGTAKVHAAYKRKNLKLVTPEWLWTCAERWEKVDERMFPLKNAKPNTESRHPPAHCRSPEHPEPLPYQITNNVNSNQTAGFMYSFNPLMSLSSEDIESMAGEVEDMFKESDGEADGADDTFRSVDDDDNVDDDDDTNDASQANVGRKRKLERESSSSSAEEDESRFERFSKIKKRKRCKQSENDFDIDETPENEDNDDDDDDDDKECENSDDDETINSKFRRGEKLPSDLDMDYNTEDGTEEEQESDGEWNVMGAALEREFLEGE